MTLLRKDQVTGGATFELACARRYPAGHWSPDFLYLPDEPDGIGRLVPYLNPVLRPFAYDGPNRVTLEQWGRVRALAAEAPDLAPFFEAVETWLHRENRNAPYFWILGI